MEGVALARTARIKTEAALYHLTLRGNGRQLLFEDDDDRKLFLGLVKTRMQAASVSVIAWCLMDNHVHLLVSDPSDHLADAMRSLGTSYAQHFNEKHGHVGHVFQGRYGSKPVLDERHLLEAVRYIHANPAEAGMGAAESYCWSSYAEYAHAERASNHLCDTKLVLELLGSPQGFIEFSEQVPDIPYETIGAGRIPDEAMTAVAQRIAETFGLPSIRDVSSQSKDRRNKVLNAMRSARLSVRQIERLTGIGRATVYRVTSK